MKYPNSLQELIEYFKLLPGIGEKNAERLAFAVLKFSDEQVEGFSDSLKNVKNKIKKCEICNNLTENDKCDICLDQSRSSDVLCVVENTKNLILFEKANVFNGKYHVLEGLISPLEGINPEDIKINQLINRIKDEKIKEVKSKLKDENINPRDIKMDLAREIVSLYHTAEEVDQAEERFKMIFQMGQKPKDIDTINAEKENFDLIQIVVDKGLVSSKSEFRRLLAQGGVKINDKKITKEEFLPKEGEFVVQIGKKKFIKIIVS